MAERGRKIIVWSSGNLPLWESPLLDDFPKERWYRVSERERRSFECLKTSKSYDRFYTFLDSFKEIVFENELKDLCCAWAMAQTLVEDRSYNLTGDDNINDKSLYYVKLTDSCLKAIEEYIIHKVCNIISYLMDFQSLLYVIKK